MDKSFKQYDLLAAGRAGIDFNPVHIGHTFALTPEFTKSVGGSPSNIVIGAAKLGLRTGFIGKTSYDGMGEYICQTFRHFGIGTEGLVFDHTGARNCLAILEVISSENSGAYESKGDDCFHGTYLYREKTADMLLCAGEISEEQIAASRSVVVTGTAFSMEPSRSAMFRILELARKHHVTTVLDLDYRPYGWTGLEEASACYQKMLPQCDIILGNRQEFDVVELTAMPENKDNRVSAETMLKNGADIVIVKDGSNGSWGYSKNAAPVFRACIPTKILKTFGSGDAYAAGFMYGFLNGHSLAESIEFGTANASLALAGGISCSESMPSVDQMLAHREKSLSCWEGNK